MSERNAREQATPPGAATGPPSRWLSRTHPWNREAARVAEAAMTVGQDDVAVATGLFAIADRLADLAEVLAAEREREAA